MTWAARLEIEADSSERRGSPRAKLRLESFAQQEDGGAGRVVIHDLSTSGLLIEADLAITLGDLIDVDLPNGEVARSTVTWMGGRLFGCQFRHAVPQPMIDAAIKRSQLSADFVAPGDSSMIGADAEEDHAGDATSHLSPHIRVQVIILITILLWTAIIASIV